MSDLSPDSDVAIQARAREIAAMEDSVEFSCLLPDPEKSKIPRDGDPPYPWSEPRWPDPESSGLEWFNDDYEPEYDAPLLPETLPPGISFTNCSPEELEVFDDALRFVRQVAWKEWKAGLQPTGGHKLCGVMYRAPCTYTRPEAAIPEGENVSEWLKWRLAVKDRADEEEMRKPARLRARPGRMEIMPDDNREWRFCGRHSRRPLNEQILEETVRFGSLYYFYERAYQELACRPIVRPEPDAQLGYVSTQDLQDRRESEEWRQEEVWDLITYVLKRSARRSQPFTVKTLDLMFEHTTFHLDQIWEDHIQSLGRSHPFVQLLSSISSIPDQNATALMSSWFSGDRLKKAILAAKCKIYASDGRMWNIWPESYFVFRMMRRIVRHEAREDEEVIVTQVEQPWGLSSHGELPDLDETVKAVMKLFAEEKLKENIILDWQRQEEEGQTRVERHGNADADTGSPLPIADSMFPYQTGRP